MIMLLNDLKDIKKIRKRVSLTQKELAEKANVSQSMIAKIESGILEPSYKKGLKIIEALEAQSKKISKKAEDIMTKKIISTTADEKLGDAIKKLEKFKISQMPVMKENVCVGLITESSILNSTLEKKKVHYVKDVMEECPPIINKNFSLDSIAELLKITPLLLISDKGKLIGVITKSDVIKNIK